MGGDHQLVSPDNKKKTNTAATRPIYAIIGVGFAAIVNHWTMRYSDWGKTRLNRVEVLHIHEGDPWNYYVGHGMGQWTELLTLPGFDLQPSSKSVFASSSEFAKITSEEFKSIQYNYPSIRLIKGRVEKIQRKKIGSSDKFSIRVNGQPDEIIADYLDVCSGPGYSRLVERTTDRGKAYDFEARPIMIDDVLYNEYSAPPDQGPSKRRVLTAQLYMHANIAATVASVCVFGGGPLAASCVERAIAAGVDAVYWVSTMAVNRSFAPGLRYDDLARLDNQQPLPRRLEPVQDKTLLYPARGLVKFAEGYKVAEVKVSSSNPTRITLKFATGKPPGRSGPRYIDWQHPDQKELRELEVDQLVISASSQTLENEPGSAAYLVKDVRNADGGTLQPIKPVPSNNKVPGIGAVTVGVQTKDGKFRMLGTAGLTQTDRAKEDNNPKKPSRLRLWEMSLPAQAHVNLVGVTISAATVAQANGFFQKNPNDCVNIAHNGELWSVWGNENGLLIYNARRQRVDPFTKDKSSPDEKTHPLPAMPDGYYQYRDPGEYWGMKII